MTKKANKNNSLALSTADGARGMLTILNEKIAALKHIEESVYKTGGNLEEFGDIKAETKVENLIRAFSSVRGRENAYNDAAKELGLKTYPVYTVNGGNAEDWKKDILLRKAIIEHKDELDTLNAFKAKAADFLSKEDQQMMLIDEMKKHFGAK